MKLTVPGSRAQPGGWIDPGIDRRSDPAGALLATIAATRPKPGGSVLNRRGVIIQAAPTAHGSNTTIRLHPIGPAIGRRGKGRCGSKWGSSHPAAPSALGPPPGGKRPADQLQRPRETLREALRKVLVNPWIYPDTPHSRRSTSSHG